MFTTLSDQLGEATVKNNLSVFHEATVTDNQDPKQIGCVKIQILGLFESGDNPWAYPVVPFFLGGSNNSGIYSIPEIGSKVFVFFPYGDLYSPFYLGHIRAEGQVNSLFKQSYPNSYGYHDSKGNWFRVDKEKGETEFHHHSGTHVKIENTGTVIITGQEDVIAEIEGDVDITVKGKVDVAVDGNMEMRANNIRLESVEDITLVTGGYIHANP